MLNTENASALVNGGEVNAGQTRKVKMLIGTFVKSVGKDVKEGAVIQISDVDYRFLKPYGYCEDYKAEQEPAVVPPAVVPPAVVPPAVVPPAVVPPAVVPPAVVPPAQGNDPKPQDNGTKPTVEGKRANR
jgi:hypothetical protein